MNYIHCAKVSPSSSIYDNNERERERERETSSHTPCVSPLVYVDTASSVQGSSWCSSQSLESSTDSRPSVRGMLAYTMSWSRLDIRSQYDEPQPHDIAWDLTWPYQQNHQWKLSDGAAYWHIWSSGGLDRAVRAHFPILSWPRSLLSRDQTMDKNSEGGGGIKSRGQQSLMYVLSRVLKWAGLFRTMT